MESRQAAPISGPSPLNALKTVDKAIVIIAVMGATGSGKSTFINLISGSKLRVGTDLKSCTSDVHETAPFSFGGRSVVLFDTPGFDDTTKSDTDILKLIAKFLADTYQNGAILSGVIYMHRISDVRMGGIAVRNFSMFRKLCGEKSLKNVAIVTNFWSEVAPAVGAAREGQLRSDDGFFKPVLDKQAKLLRHDGTLAGARMIVAEIVKNHPMALGIQEEMVDEKKSILETAAGTELNRELVEQARKHAEAMEEIREEMKVAIRERDEESQQELRMAANKLKAEMERVEMDFRKLQADHDEDKARMKEEIRFQEQQKAVAELDMAKKELAESERRREEESKQEMERKELQDKVQAQQQEMFSAEQDAMRKEMSELKRRHKEEREKDTQMKELNAALDARVKSSMQEVAAAGAPVKWLADFLLHGRQVTLHHLYKAVMLSVSDWKAGETTDTYRRILGIIVISQVPLTDSAIVDVLGLGQDSISTCRTALRRLGCVIQWSEGQSARMLHTSFPDYLTDESACSSEPWFIDVNEHQRALTLGCLHIMKEGLHFNMGDLKTSYIANADVPDLSGYVEAVIPHSLSYACRFWGHHLRQTIPGEPSIQGLILQFFEVKFLYWLEVLSLCGEMPLASRVLESVMEHVVNPTNKVYAFAQDALKFVGAFAPTLACSTPHIYLSCIPFAPRASLIKQQYTPALSNILMVESGIDENWSALQQVFEEHTRSVQSVVFSPDGQRIASGSGDKIIRLWDATSGALVAGPFKGHTSYLQSAFLPDGQRAVSVLDDGTVQMWDAKPGASIIGPFKGHTSSILSVVFSPDGQRIASGSHDCTIRIWNAKTGARVVGPFKGHTGYVFAVAFSPDGQRIASGSADRTIRIWDARTGTLIAGPFKGHTDWVQSVVFSPDGQCIASGSNDKTIRIWDAQTGALIAGPFKGHTDWVQSVVFSPDGQHIASGSDDCTIRIWDAKTGTLIAGPCKGHTSDVNSVVFSPDGQRIASGSDDCTIRIWDAKAGALIAMPFEGHTGGVNSVVFSPDSQRIASGSDDKTIRIWDAKTSALASGAFQGHKAFVNTTSSSQKQHCDTHNRLGGPSQLENGWMVNSSGGFLFYVPHEYREGLWWPHHTAVISEKSTWLDLTRFVHGEDWVRCHI